MAAKYTTPDYVFQFITVTAGVLIALFIDGLADLRADRALVENARSMIRRELADNKKDLEATLSGIAADQENMRTAIRFADELLSTRKTTINSVQLHYNVADQISDSSWRTAERTGALALMDYDEVQRFSRVYDFQELFMAQQRQTLTQVVMAGGFFKADFDLAKPNAKDLELFRTRVMDLLGLLSLQEDFGKKLVEDYAAALNP
jgi:hypothetical protein